MVGKGAHMQTCLQFPRLFGFAPKRLARAQPIPLCDNKDLRTFAISAKDQMHKKRVLANLLAHGFEVREVLQ
jgi:hypothetical protein